MHIDLPGNITTEEASGADSEQGGVKRKRNK